MPRWDHGVSGVLNVGAQREPELFGGADVLVVVNGKADPDVIFRKTFALQLWLTGYELNDCAFLFTKNAMHVLSTKKKSNDRVLLRYSARLIMIWL